MRYHPIEPQLFIDNRQRLAAKLSPHSMAVLNSNDVMPTSADGVHPFIQQTDLFYLCGIDQEESILVLCPDAVETKHREILFVRQTNETIALWEGPRYTKEQAADASGIATVYWTSEFEKIFRPLVLESDSIYLNSNEHLRAESSVVTRDQRFLQWCRKAFPLHRYQRLAPLMHELRAVKSEAEIALIRQACGITEAAFRRLLGFIRPGVWEFEIEAEIMHAFIRRRSRGPAYAPIIASGAGACILHYIKNNQQCRDGDLVLMDFGAEYANYASDLTRTVPVNGRFSPRQRQVYETVWRVHRGAIDLLRPGKTLDDYHKAVGRLMEKELIELGLLKQADVKDQDPDKPLYKKYFMHGTSHHMGLDVHDYGQRHRPFEPGMVLTCEPGIYIPDEDIGIRLENDILISDDDPIDLMASIPIDPDEIEELMAAGDTTP
jgi:Xaa-Pro aminopeptidase